MVYSFKVKQIKYIRARDAYKTRNDTTYIPEAKKETTQEEKNTDENVKHTKDVRDKFSEMVFEIFMAILIACCVTVFLSHWKDMVIFLCQIMMSLVVYTTMIVKYTASVLPTESFKTEATSLYSQPLNISFELLPNQDIYILHTKNEDVYVVAKPPALCELFVDVLPNKVTKYKELPCLISVDAEHSEEIKKIVLGLDESSSSSEPKNPVKNQAIENDMVKNQYEQYWGNVDELCSVKKEKIDRLWKYTIQHDYTEYPLCSGFIAVIEIEYSLKQKGFEFILVGMDKYHEIYVEDDALAIKITESQLSKYNFDIKTGSDFRKIKKIAFREWIDTPYLAYVQYTITCGEEDRICKNVDFCKSVTNRFDHVLRKQNGCTFSLNGFYDKSNLDGIESIMKNEFGIEIESYDFKNKINQK